MERVKTISHYEPFSIDFLKLNIIITFFFFLEIYKVMVFLSKTYNPS